MRVLVRLAVAVPIVAVAVLPPAAASPSPDGAACAAERDRRLAVLAQEEQSIKTQLDTDAAAIDAPEYRLRKTARALEAEFAADRAAAEAAYRACLRRRGAP